MAHAAFRRGAVIAVLFCAPLTGCAGSGGGGSGSAAAADRSGRFEGWYQGRQTPSNSYASACRGRTRDIWFAVKNGTIEMRTSRSPRNRRKLNMLGTVSADGSVAIRQATGRQSVVGRIEGDRLTAATVQETLDIRSVQSGGKAPCAYRYEATRLGSSGAAGRDGDTAAIGAAPPVERFPQP